MNNKNEKKSRWQNSKVFYAVAMSLVLAIVGVASVIYNLSKIKNVVPDNGESGLYTVTVGEKTTTDHIANKPQTGIPDERNTTAAEQTEKSTVNDLNRPYTGKYLLPLDSTLTKSYSESNVVFSKTMNDWRVHDGIDIKGNVGDNAVAINDGTVTAVYNDALWGDIIEIEHGNGLKAKYCGIKSELKAETTVKQGQIIGTVTQIPIEKEDGVHVHLETSVEDKAVDPVKALNLMSDTATTE